MTVKSFCASLVAVLSAACSTPPPAPPEKQIQIITDPVTGCTYTKAADDPPDKPRPCRVRATEPSAP